MQSPVNYSSVFSFWNMLGRTQVPLIFYGIMQYCTRHCTGIIAGKILASGPEEGFKMFQVFNLLLCLVFVPASLFFWLSVQQSLTGMHSLVFPP